MCDLFKLTCCKVSIKKKGIDSESIYTLRKLLFSEMIGKTYAWIRISLKYLNIDRDDHLQFEYHLIVLYQ